jgi:hypothetical protein
MSSSHELAELAAAEALASSLDVSDSEEEDSDESAGPEAVTFPKSLPKAVPPSAPFETEESRLEIKSTESGAGQLTDLFLSVDTKAHVVDVEEEEEEEDDVEEVEEDDVEEVEEEDSRLTGSAGDTAAFTGKENIPCR